MDATPDRMSHCSDLSDSALRSSFEAAVACGMVEEELVAAEAAAAPLASDAALELESDLLPVCGLKSHEDGIALLREALADGRAELDWLPTQMSSSSPRCGGQDDWEHMRPFLLKQSPSALPMEFVVVPATYFRDPEFQVPDVEEACVLVTGGVSNTFHEGATGGCHFMPLLPAKCKAEYEVKVSSSTKWRDMAMAVEGRVGNVAFLEERVRDAGDCYFHSILLALHFKGVVFQVERSAMEENASCPPGADPQKCLTPPPSQPSLGQPSPRTTPSQTQSEKRVACDPRGLCFEDALVEEEVGDNLLKDPVVGLWAKIKETSDAAELDRLLFPESMFNDLKNKESVYDLVKSNLKQAWEDKRNHRQLSEEEDFDVRLCAATPMAEAMHTVARAKGVATEALLGCVECNIGFLEAPGTTLTHNRRSHHDISPGSPVIVGSASSTRKSALIKMTDEWLTSVPGASQEFADKSVLTTDCTTKGVRNCLQEFGRCGVSTDEAANTFDTTMSDKEAGIHFVSMTKLNTWTQSEYDGSATGHSKTSLEKYQFLLKAAGQTEVVEQIVQPKVHGFQKRLKQVWCLADMHTHDSQRSQASEDLVTAWHTWMHENWASAPPVQLALDGRALSMYQAVKSAITDFLEETRMPVVYKSKLMFWHSDILRDCHKVFRATQFLQSMSQACVAPLERQSMSLDEFTCALHKWICQVRTHFASYRFATLKQEEASSSERRGNAAHTAVLCVAVESSLPEATHEDTLMKTLMVRAPHNTWFTSADVRCWLKNKRSESYKGNLSDKIEKAMKHLADHHLLDFYEPSARQHTAASFTQRAAKRNGGSSVTGRSGILAKKRGLSEIQADEKAEQEQRRLRLSANDFSG